MLDLAGNKIIELECDERPEHRNKPHDKNSDAQGPLPCPLKTPPAGKDDERHRAEINEIERV